MSVTSRPDREIFEIVLDNPERRNALGFATLDAILEGIRHAETSAARAIVVSAVGPVFSAGADFDDLHGTSADIAYDDALATVTAALRASVLPVVAAVHGPCLGAGVDLALSADLIVVGRAARFEVPATRLGILYNPSALAILHGRVPGALLRRLMFGIPVSAEEAYAAGLAAALVDEPDTAAHAMSLARHVAGGLPAAITATKQLLTSLDSGDHDLDRWQLLRAQLLDAEERRRIITARQRSPRT